MTKKTLFLNGWYFTKQPLGSTLEDIKERKEKWHAFLAKFKKEE